MHLTKRAVLQALCVASSFPRGAGRGSHALVAPGTVGRSSSFASSGSSRFGWASASAFAPPLSSSKRIRRRSLTRAAEMSSSTGDVAQVGNRVALLQMPVTSDKSQNLQTAKECLLRARDAGARLCVLPEIWNSPYATAAFPEYAEILPRVGDSLADGDDGTTEAKGVWGESSAFLMDMAKSTGMYVIGGSIPETCDGKIYNTCLCVDPSGKIVGKHRKVHLFDIDVPGGIRFKESETLTGGEGATYFDVDEEDDDDGGGLGRIGVGICYDIRFPEYALLLTQEHGCKILIYPGAFNLTTGPAHWELLQRARAVDGQCYVLAASPARTSPPPDEDDDDGRKKYPHYAAWGHSTVVSPWGEVVATCDEGPAMVVADLDMKKVEEMRNAIPTMGQKRHDLYRLVPGDDA